MDSASSNARKHPFDVLVLAASAGGHTAVETVFHGLPADFPLPILIMQHLAQDNTGTVQMYGQRLPFSVDWVQTDSILAPGKVLICPPKTFVEVLPDGSFVLSPNERGAMDKPIDRLFNSLTRSFGERVLGVILTGQLNDGALGAQQIHSAGGKVIVQNDATAEYGDMPKAAIQAGAADLVVPLQDIGQVIGEMVAGSPRPRPRSEIEAIRRVFGDKGEIAALAHEIDWSSHPLGPVHGWPTQLRDFVRLVIEFPDAAQLLWGGERRFIFFNEPSRLTFGERWKTIFGSPYDEAFPNLPEAARLQMRVLGNEHIRLEEMLLSYERNGRLQDAWFDIAYTPVRGTDGTVQGVYIVWHERTREVLVARRLKLLNQIAVAQVATNRREALMSALAVLKANADIPFAVAYLLDAPRNQALLVGATGVEEGGAMAPHQLPILSATAAWPLKQILDEGNLLIVDDLMARFRDQPDKQDQATLESAVLYPLRDRAEGRVIGVLVLGTNPRLPLDEPYREFLALLSEAIVSKVAESHARQREIERLERLAELDRIKTEFYTNISHEFRTPLTLLLAPLEDLLRRRAELPVPLVNEVEVAAHNSRRLLRLVNSLLDFSQIESRRQLANFEPTDLCAFTADIASSFRSAIETAGLSFRVEGDRNLPPVWVDREMWEKIVSNLLSNALKFTFEGEITVKLHALSLHAELVVKDTGIGIPEQEIPNIFKRFHRIRGARARTAEGSGIGLSIVDDLVNRMSGQLRVRSKENAGTEFTIWIPYKSARIKTELPVANESPETRAFAGELAREASQWLENAGQPPVEVIEDFLGPPSSNKEALQGCILVADDNPDMRDYLKRLFSPRWKVELVVDGESALKAAISHRPDVILADVMMPGLDGFELLKRIRENSQLKQTPVVLLTARAGEEAAIQGLLAGADDYIAKPFSPRELMTRIQAVFEHSRAEEALRVSEEKYRTLFETIDEGFCLMELVCDDSGGGIVDMIYREVNGSFERQTGARDVVGKRSSEVMPGLERHWRDVITRVYETGVPEQVENYAEDFDRWFSVHVSRIGGVGSGRLAFVFEDVTVRKLRERQQEFLLKLSDALRPLSDAAEIEETAYCLLGEHLGVDRVYYPQLDRAGEHWNVEREYLRGTSPSLVGIYPSSAYHWALPFFRRSEPVIVADVHHSDIIPPEDVPVMDMIYISAIVSVPLVRKGELVSTLSITENAPRVWKPEEIELVRETLERTWAAVERARAEAELQARNNELERFNKVTVGRELRMIELKKQVNALCEQLGEPPCYALESEKHEEDSHACTSIKKRASRAKQRPPARIAG